MALANGDTVIPAAVLAATTLGASDPSSGTLAKKVLFGVRVGPATIYWSNGEIALLGDEVCLRKVAPALGAHPFTVGMNVQVTGKGPAFRGVVRSALQVELGTTGGTGILSNCVIIRTASGREILVPASNVTEVSN
jgi:hypothetical protein